MHPFYGSREGTMKILTTGNKMCFLGPESKASMAQQFYGLPGEWCEYFGVCRLHNFQVELENTTFFFCHKWYTKSCLQSDFDLKTVWNIFKAHTKLIFLTEEILLGWEKFFCQKTRKNKRKEWELCGESWRFSFAGFAAAEDMGCYDPCIQMRFA